MITIPIVSVKLVRESNHRYNLSTKKASSPDDAVRIINAALDLSNEAQEVFGVLYLDSQNKVTGIQEITRGTLTSSVVHPRETFKGAILHNACSIIVFHNHPSGEPKPSLEDKVVTKKLIKAGKLLDIPVLDHIVIGDSCFQSLRENSDLEF